MSQSDILCKTLGERVSVRVFPSQMVASIVVARRIAELIRAKQAAGMPAVLGLATGNTPIQVYAELVRMHREEGLSFANVVTFNLDEYYPMPASSALSYVSFMRKHLFDHVDIPQEQIHIPDGTLDEEAILGYCRDYDQKIEDFGGLDFQLLGIGLTGHIGFNEPGSTPDTVTRLVTLADLTRRDAIDTFGGLAHVPEKAITMGMRSILQAREIVLMAWSPKKAEIVKKALEGEISAEVPATFLQLCPQVEFILDRGAASLLSEYV